MKENQHIEWNESWRDSFLKWTFGFTGIGGCSWVDNAGITTQETTQEKVSVFLRAQPFIIQKELFRCIGIDEDVAKYLLNKLKSIYGFTSAINAMLVETPMKSKVKTPVEISERILRALEINRYQPNQAIGRC